MATPDCSCSSPADAVAIPACGSAASPRSSSPRTPPVESCVPYGWTAIPARAFHTPGIPHHPHWAGYRNVGTARGLLSLIPSPERTEELAADTTSLYRGGRRHGPYTKAPVTVYSHRGLQCLSSDWLRPTGAGHESMGRITQRQPSRRSWRRSPGAGPRLPGTHRGSESSRR